MPATPASLTFPDDLSVLGAADWDKVMNDAEAFLDFLTRGVLTGGNISASAQLTPEHVGAGAIVGSNTNAQALGASEIARFSIPSDAVDRAIIVDSHIDFASAHVVRASGAGVERIRGSRVYTMPNGDSLLQLDGDAINGLPFIKYASDAFHVSAETVGTPIRLWLGVEADTWPNDDEANVFSLHILRFDTYSSADTVDLSFELRVMDALTADWTFTLHWALEFTPA